MNIVSAAIALLVVTIITSFCADYCASWNTFMNHVCHSPSFIYSGCLYRRIRYEIQYSQAVHRIDPLADCGTLSYLRSPSNAVIEYLAGKRG